MIWMLKFEHIQWMTFSFNVKSKVDPDPAFKLIRILMFGIWTEAFDRSIYKLGKVDVKKYQYQNVLNGECVSCCTNYVTIIPMHSNVPTNKSEF